MELLAAVLGALVGGAIALTATYQQQKHNDRAARERSIEETVRLVLASAERLLAQGVNPAAEQVATLSSSLIAFEAQLRALGREKFASKVQAAYVELGLAVGNLKPLDKGDLQLSVKAINRLVNAINDAMSVARSWWGR